MLTPDQISEVHRLHWVEKWSLRRIAQQLRIGRRTLTKYLETPAQKPARRDRASKLDPFKAAIGELLQHDSSANAPVIAQRLRPLGYFVRVRRPIRNCCAILRNDHFSTQWSR